MREILFRAKHYRTKQWVYGIPFKNPLSGSEDAYYPQIIPEVHGVHSTINSCSIIEETIGQFTGLTDKNGVKIFEGDIIKSSDTGNLGIVSFQDKFNQIGFCIAWEKRCYYREDLGFWARKRYIEVIGNVYDNPELIGGESDD